MDPFQQRASNSGFSDRWTSPSCYFDLPNKSEGDTTCPSCDAKLRLSVEYEPMSVADIITGDEDED
jgi:hypothetical protein